MISTAPAQPRIRFLHNRRMWVARQYPTSDPKLPLLWVIKPVKIGAKPPDIRAYWAAKAHFKEYFGVL